MTVHQIFEIATGRGDNCREDDLGLCVHDNHYHRYRLRDSADRTAAFFGREVKSSIAEYNGGPRGDDYIKKSDVYDVAMKYAKDHGWCEVVTEALREAGIVKPKKPLKSLTIEIPEDVEIEYDDNGLAGKLYTLVGGTSTAKLRTMISNTEER